MKIKKRFCVLLILFAISCVTGINNLNQLVVCYAAAEKETEIITVTSEEQLVTTLKDCFRDMIDVFELSVVASVDVGDVLDALVLNNVELIEWNYYENMYSNGEKVERSFVTYEFTVTYRDDARVLRAYENPDYKAKLTNREAELLSKAISIVEKVIQPEMNDFEKALAVHDYLVLNGKYDVRVSTNTLPESSYRAEGILLNGVGVCNSYASSMNLLLSIAGLECITVTGEGIKDGVSESHAWNKVKIDGEWYNIDATWDDPVPDTPGKTRYAYFNVTDEFLARDHLWDKNVYPQKADATAYNYYVYNGLIASNPEEFKAVVIGAAEKQSGSNKITVRVYVKNYDAKAFDLNFVFDAFPAVKRVLYTDMPKTEGEMLLDLIFE